MANKFDDIYKELVLSNTEGPKKRSYTFDFDLKGNFISVSPEAAEFAGYSTEAIETMSVWDVVSEKDHELMLEKFAARKEGRPVEPYEVTLIKRDGMQVRIKVLTTPVIEDGKVVKIKGSIFPI